MSIPEKKEVIFKAVLSLLRQGKEIADLHISEIAQEAGIGKGTVYEYFSSREELLLEMLLYHREKEYQAIRTGLLCTGSFDERLTVLEDRLLLFVQRGDSGCSLFSQRAVPQSLFQRIWESPEMQSQNCERLDEFCGYLTEAAVAEGLIAKEPDKAYGRMVFLGCFMAFAGISRGQSEERRLSKIRADLRRMLLSALSGESIPPIL